MVGLTLISSIFTPKPTMNMKPASFADFQVTQTNEGQPVPLTYGIVNIPGNIIFYGNLYTVEEKQKAGGKGGGGGDVVTGYKYYMDVWQGIAQGKVNLITMYEDSDTTKGVSSLYQKFNDGTNGVYPTTADASQLTYASSIPGVAHIFFKRLYCGENKTYVPTINFKIQKVLSTGLRNENMSNGSNPAGAVYDLLVNIAGLSPNDVNYDNFNQASDYYYSKGWGINYVISSSTQAKEGANKILEFVDSYLDYDSNGKIVIKIFRPDDTPVGTIQDDWISFSLAKPSWNTIYNQFVGNYVDNGVTRTLILENPATQLLAGMKVRQEIDLTAFIDQATAMARLSEFMKQGSYPRMTLNLKLPIKYAMYSIGDVLTVINSDIGLNGNFRILSISEPAIDSNEITMQLLEQTEAKMDTNFLNVGGTQWVQPTFTATPLTHIKIVELDYISGISNPALLILANKEMGYETGFAVYGSLDGSNYELLTTCSSWATAGVLDGPYSSNTYDIDPNGLLFTPYKEFYTYASTDMTGLFTQKRVLVVDDEIMAFQNLNPYGTADYSITGIIRGLLWTTKADHSSGAQAWINNVGDNILSVPYNVNTFYLKVAPIVMNSVLDLSQVTAVKVTLTNKANIPIAPQAIVATRSGANVNINIFAVTKTNLDGAGYQNADTYTDTYPFIVEGSFEVTIGGTVTVYTTPNITISSASAFTVSVRHYNNGQYSSSKSLYVGASDGVYSIN
jgi:hypothetical protein